MSNLKATVVNDHTTVEDPYVTRAEVEEIIDSRLSAIRIYVSASDITSAQENIRAITHNAEF